MKHILRGILLIAGTSIGAGMLALPVVSAEGGFFPALFVYLLCWLFMTATGLLFLELCLKLPPDSNIITMAKTYLGFPGKLAAWALYLFLFYCLSIAYISGGGALLQSWLGLDVILCQIIFVFFLGSCVYLGAWMVDRLNVVLMAGLILSYLAFVAIGLPHIHFTYLEHVNWGASFLALPVIFTSFSYQGIIPSLTHYLKRDAKSIRMAIIGGTSLAFAIYIIWEILILGIIPLDGLKTAKELGQTAVYPLKEHLMASYLMAFGQAFAFFAMATSFLGVTLGLFDFLADGLSMAKKGGRKVILALLTFVPPFIVVLINPSLFLVALSYAGGIGCALLLGLMPALMVWVSRFSREKDKVPTQLFGGRFVLLLLFFFVIFELSIETITGLFKS